MMTHNSQEEGDHIPVLIWEAEASGFIHLHSNTIELIRKNQLESGDMISTIENAGIQAVKHAPELMPNCPIKPLSFLDIKINVFNNGLEVTSIVKSEGQHDVEMEAIIAVSVALLSAYDMCRNIDHGMALSDVKIIRKTRK